MLEPADFPTFLSEDEELNRQRTELLKWIIRLHPKICIAILSARANPHARGSSRLLGFNNAFKELCDSPGLVPGDLRSAIPPKPVFLSERTARDASASMQRIFSIVGSINASPLQHATTEVLRISMLGRIRYTYMEVFAMRKEGVLKEVIVAERILPDNHVLANDLYVPYGLVDERFLGNSQSLPDQSPPENVASCPLLDAPSPRSLQWTQVDVKDVRKVRKPPVKRLPLSQFICAECKSSQTTQRRYHSWCWIFDGK